VIPATWKVEVGRKSRGSQFETILGKEVSETPSQQISWAWWFMSAIPAIQEATVRKIMVCAQPWAKAQDPIKKILKQKDTGAQ
jgi:hypothetical protein